MPFLDTTDARWTNLLEQVNHDMYHLPGYCSIEAWLIGGRATVWYHSDGFNELLIPLIARSISETNRMADLVSPYGYPGVLSKYPLNTEEAELLMETYHQEAAVEGFVSSFIRLNPLLNNWRFAPTPIFRQWMHGGTVSVSLEGISNPLSHAYSLNHKRNLKRLAGAGFHALINDWDSINEFIDAYRQTVSSPKNSTV